MSDNNHDPIVIKNIKYFGAPRNEGRKERLKLDDIAIGKAAAYWAG